MSQLPESIFPETYSNRTPVTVSSPNTPLDDQRARVEQLSRVGAAEEDIAAELQIPLKRLKKCFRRELERGNARGKNELLTELFEKATSGNIVNATWSSVKARCGWRDTGTPNDSPTEIHSILNLIGVENAHGQIRT